LFAVTVLTVILAASLFSPVAASGYVTINKVTTNGDITTIFAFTSGFDTQGFQLVGGGSKLFSAPAGGFEPGSYGVTEIVPPGWVLTNVECTALNNLPVTTTFTYRPGGVDIKITAIDGVDCTFTNSPISPAVGGVVMPANTLAILAPWLAVIGVVGCLGTVAAVVKKRGK
jgi:hypothetical protein